MGAVTGDCVIKSHRASLEVFDGFAGMVLIVKADKQRQQVGIRVCREVKKPCNFGLVSVIVVVFHGNVNGVRDI